MRERRDKKNNMLITIGQLVRFKRELLKPHNETDDYGLVVDINKKKQQATILWMTNDGVILEKNTNLDSIELLE